MQLLAKHELAARFYRAGRIIHRANVAPLVLGDDGVNDERATYQSVPVRALMINVMMDSSRVLAIGQYWHHQISVLDRLASKPPV